MPSRSPHGERGLKFPLLYMIDDVEKSLPPRGAWIEISQPKGIENANTWSLPPRGAWIEIQRNS